MNLPPPPKVEIVQPFHRDESREPEKSPARKFEKKPDPFTDVELPKTLFKKQNPFTPPK